MHSDAKYKNLQSENIYAKHIIAEEITLQDTSIRCDPMIAGATIKKMYESQPNTNVFDDNSKKSIRSLNESFPQNNQNVHMFKLPLLCDFDTTTLLNQHAVMCIDNEGTIVYVCKHNNVIKHYTLPVYEPYVKISLNAENDKPFVKIDVI
jgi:hypothetical protein